MIEVGWLVFFWLLTLAPPVIALVRCVEMSGRVFRGPLMPKHFLVGASMAIGLAGYSLLIASLLCFWGIFAYTVFLTASAEGSVLVPVGFASAAFLVPWVVSEALICVGCRAKRANSVAAA